ncbi:MAG: aspartate/glutamate racemase family protein [Kiritimatiellia bacterium]|nr:aspartate/glutamate racemase family protein [Lentisphaerota bacterium]
MDDPIPVKRLLDIPHLADRKQLSLVIMDSGMGGLSICADLVERLRRSGLPTAVQLTYFNAWPESGRGYNALEPVQQSRVFDRALRGALAFAPDAIILACNTLSILYKRTDFATACRLPVIGILDYGVDLIRDYLMTEPAGRVIILGTRTTIAADAHRRALLEQGVAGSRLAVQACDGLASLIENDPHGRAVRESINVWLGQAFRHLPAGGSPVSLALCCTHYGYSAALFQAGLARLAEGGRLLNPNQAMAQGLLAGLPEGVSSIDTLRVVSRIAWQPRQIAAIGSLLGAVSPLTARALEQYRHDPDLFEL